MAEGTWSRRGGGAANKEKNLKQGKERGKGQKSEEGSRRSKHQWMPKKAEHVHERLTTVTIAKENNRKEIKDV